MGRKTTLGYITAESAAFVLSGGESDERK